MTNPPSPVRSRRRAIALPAVLLLVFVGLGIALSIHRYSTETYRRTSRGIYATMSEVMAESAAEEAWYTLQRDVNTPGTELYGHFRSENEFDDYAVDLPVLRGKLNDPQFGGYIAERYDASGIQASISMRWGNPYGNAVQGISANGEFDSAAPWERYGTVTIVASAKAKSRIEGLANYRKMIVKRAFRVVKATPPVPFDRTGLVILYPEHMTNVVTAGLLDNPTNFDVNDAIGGKARLEPMLRQANTLIDQASTMARNFNNSYKGACRPPFGDHLTPPPQWLQKILDEVNGLMSQATKLDIEGAGRRPFMFDDSVIVSRFSMEGGNLGNLSEFNYSKNIGKELKPLNEIAKVLNDIQQINTGIIQALEYPHQLVPYGAALDLLVVPMYAIIPELVGSVKDVCTELHEKLMDPVLEICVGVGQVLSLAQKIIIEVPMMGQQAFAGFQQQIAGAASNAVNTAVSNININNIDLQGLPTNTAAMGFSLNMPLPNYTTGDEVEATAGISGDELLKTAGEALVGTLIGIVEREVVSFVITQITKLTVQITASIIATTAACAGPQAVFTCIPAKTAAAIAFDIINRAVKRFINATLSRIGSLKGNGLNGLIRVITRQIPFFRDNPILVELRLEDLLGRIVQAAFEKRDISTEVEQFVQNLAQNMAQKIVQQATSAAGLDKLGGVLKGYTLRHRFRNLVEFDGASGMSAFGGQGAVAGSGSDGLNQWRSAFDRVYKESLWRKKATWIVRNKDEFEGLRSRYCDGVFKGRPFDPAGDGTNRWTGSSYGPNAISADERYGLSGIIFYEGNQDLELDFPDGDRAFKGKCILYAPNAKVIVKAMKLRSTTADAFTLICGKNVELPPGEVWISVHAIGSGEDCKVKMTGSNIKGNLVLKRYTVQNQDDPKASLDGTLDYDERLNGSGGPAIGGMKESHLFVTISPFVISREMETFER